MSHQYTLFPAIAAALLLLYALYRFLKWLLTPTKRRRGDYTSTDGTYWDFDPLPDSNSDDHHNHHDSGFDFGGGESGGGGADGSWGDDD